MTFSSFRNSIPHESTKRHYDLKDLKEGETIHHSLSIYNSGYRVSQGVLSTHLKDHIEHNCVMRFGRALFIDGVCHNKGYLSKERIQAITDELALNPVVMTKVSLPYV